MRYEHYIRPLKAGKLPARVACVDCDGEMHADPDNAMVQHETITHWYSRNLRLVGSVYSTAPDVAGETVDGFWGGIGAMLARPGCLWVISPHASRVWSLLGLWDRLESGELYLASADERSRSYRGGRAGGCCGGRLIMEEPPCLAMLRMRDRQGLVVWVDTANYGITPDAISGCAAQTTRLMMEWFHLASDAVIRLNLGGWHGTAGSQALCGWKTGYLTHSPLAHGMGEVLQLERASYVGGRNEAWHVGRIPVPVWHVDFRSLYPAIMRNDTLPILLAGFSDRVSVDGCRALLANHLVTGKVRIETDAADYPLQTETGVLYPTGKFTTTLCDPELRDAVSLGRVRGVLACAWYAGATALRAYSEALYRERCRAEKMDSMAYREYIKRLLVCLPGKLGQSEREWRWEPNVPPTDWYGEWYESDGNGDLIRYRAIAGVVQSERQTGWAHDAVPSMAAHITSAGRMKLLESIRAAGRENVYYCDTDSLFISDVGMQQLREKNLVSLADLGMLRVLSPPALLEVFGQKHYMYGGRRTCAGMPRGRADPDPDGKSYWYTQWAGGQCAAGERPTTRRVRVRYETQTPYRCGIVGEGGMVTPYHIEQW